ncbi:unnamed protein product [Protopolystoma xenopodis]|uniref:Uncharacterized protein n=1 Tax=Protopolystoma xenopodis TaxID=117903 RepID=A0A3S5CIW6_9PLAT|nr:unnamed protein product [Protopolystoma xenopodis]
MKATPAATKGELLVVGCPTSSCFSSIASTSSSSTSAYTVMAQNSHVPLIIREFAPINTTSIGICASPEARGGPSALSGVSNSVSAAAGDSDADSGRGGSVNNLRCLFPACNDPSQQMSSLEASTSPNLVLATPTGDASFYTGQFLGDSDLEISASTAGSITYATASETTWPPFISMMLETSVPSSAPTSSVMLNSSNLIECHCSLLRERVTTPLDIYKRSSLHFNEDLLPKQNLPTLVQSHELSIPSTSMEIKVTDGHKGGKEKASHNLEGLSLLPANAQRSFRVAGCKDHNEKDEVEIAEDVSEKEVSIIQLNDCSNISYSIDLICHFNT